MTFPFFNKALLSCLCLLSALASFAQQPTEEELKLYNLIMEYRQEHNQPVIPLSKSLTIVAQTHVKDLQENRPVHGNCNMHSWSDQGPWTPCCYTPDHAQATAMWNKPRELTAYTGKGYEIAQGLIAPPFRWKAGRRQRSKAGRAAVGTMRWSSTRVCGKGIPGAPSASEYMRGMPWFGSETMRIPSK